MTTRPEDLLNESFERVYWRSSPPVPVPLQALSPGSIGDDEFRLLADTIPTLCWIANGDGYIVWYNRRWHQYCGTTPEEMEGWGWQSVHDPAQLPEVMERWRASIATGQPFEMTFPLRGADGVFRPFLTRIQPVRDASGTIARWFGVNTEIGAQVSAEGALRDREERLGFLDRLTGETASLADADAVLAATTRMLGEYLKLSVCAYADMDEDENGFTIRGDWAAPGATSIVGHYSLADFGALAVRNLGAGEPLVVNDNLRELPADDAETFQNIGIAATICMPLVKEGRLAALMAIHDKVPRKWTKRELSLLREVTARSWAHVERVAAVAELRASEARLRQLNDSLETQVALQTSERNRVWEMSRDLLAIMGFDGKLKAINPAWETTFGRDSETLLALSFREQVHPDDHAAVEQMMERLLRGETVHRFEDRILHADGSWRWISWTLVPEGEVFYAVGRDITHDKEAASELEQAQEALRQSQKMEAMGQLTGGVAHDFNNLLTPIIGSLDMLQRKDGATDRERRLIEGALQSADRAKTLVQRLLAFARRQPLQPNAVNVRALVADMAELVASTSGPQVKVVVNAEDGLPFAHADQNQLEMAILNLSVNARDAMPDGGTLTISARSDKVGSGHSSKLPRGRYVRLSVADTGVGMDEATLARAVEPFFSTKGIGRGTGLGLSMVHGLAAQLGGALAIDSKPGLGTSIDLWLPVTEVAETGTSEAATIERPATAGTALLVDDEELVRASTAEMLSDLGYKVVEASSGEDALRLVDGGVRFDVLVTDHLMPGIKGTDLARTLLGRFPKSMALLVSGYAEVEGIAPDLPRLSKPFRQAELADALGELQARTPSA